VRDDVWARLRALVQRSQAPVVACDVSEITQPDCATVDAIARLQLEARRRGRAIVLCNASAELRELLELSGLTEVIHCADGSGVQVGGQSEEREEARGVEEEGDPADPVA
jgi:ABC-type transporter Mla MlaB component